MAHETSIGKAVGIVKKQLESTCKVVADIWNSDQPTPANNLNLPHTQVNAEDLLREVQAAEEGLNYSQAARIRPPRRLCGPSPRVEQQ